MISILESPLVNLVSNPKSIALITEPKALKANISPTAARTEESITPVGGTKNEAIIKASEIKDKIKNQIFVLKSNILRHIFRY